ncbi:MAG: CopG family transcriptional regulator [Robiginitomaculum sp.]|nr:MAG: CopG family transcriptional regulator [Robiginitomaculum sp.]
MSKSTITFRTDTERRDTLDALAASRQRNRSFLINEAIDNYLEIQKWHIEHIKQALAELDRGEFVSQEDMRETFAELRARCK